MMVHHSHLRFAAIVGAACGLVYGGLTILPVYLSGCYGPNAGQGLCEIGPILFNLPSAFVVVKIIGDVAGDAPGLSPGFLAIGDAILFMIVNVLVVATLRRSNWKILTTSNLLLGGAFLVLPFVIQRFF